MSLFFATDREEDKRCGWTDSGLCKAGLYALLSILAYYLCWIINLSDCGKNRRDDNALLFATFLRRNERRGSYFKPTCPSNGERYQSDVQGRCAKSDAICYCASACECWATSNYLTSHLYKR